MAGEARDISGKGPLITASGAARGRDFTAAASDWGRADTFRYTILTLVADKNYDRAKAELDLYIESKGDYPLFKGRANRYAAHCHQLIAAIKAKKSIASMGNFSISKAQELHEHTLQHFDELKRTVKIIEQIEREMRLDDVRSTVWVIKAMVISSMAVVAFLFLGEFYRSIFQSGAVVIDASFTDFVNYVFDKLGL